MPGIRVLDVRAALAALGLAGLAALAVAIVTHLPLPVSSGRSAPVASAGLSRLQSLPLQAQSVISSTVAADSHAFAPRRTASGWGLSGGGVRADFRTGEPTLSLAGGNTLSLSLAGFGAPGAVTARGNRVSLSRSGIREWYAAGPLGVEQGFTLAHRPAGATAQGLTLSLAVGGSLRAQAAGSDINFMGPRGVLAARYGGLTAVDATGRHLPSALSVASGRVVISVNDRGARYPLTIDPLSSRATSSPPTTRRIPGFGSGVGGASRSRRTATPRSHRRIHRQLDKGAAWVFTRSDGVWSQQGQVVHPTTEGAATATSGRAWPCRWTATGPRSAATSTTARSGAAWVLRGSGRLGRAERSSSANGSSAGRVCGPALALGQWQHARLIGGAATRVPPPQRVAGCRVGVHALGHSNWGEQAEISPDRRGGANNPSHFGAGGRRLDRWHHRRSSGARETARLTWAVVGLHRARHELDRTADVSAQRPSRSRGQQLRHRDVDLSADGTTALIGGENDNSGRRGSLGVRDDRLRNRPEPAAEPRLGPATPAQAPSVRQLSIHLGGRKHCPVGANNDSNMVGAAFLFTRSAGVWTESRSSPGPRRPTALLRIQRCPGDGRTDGDGRRTR